MKQRIKRKRKSWETNLNWRDRHRKREGKKKEIKGKKWKYDERRKSERIRGKTKMR